MATCKHSGNCRQRTFNSVFSVSAEITCSDAFRLGKKKGGTASRLRLDDADGMDTAALDGGSARSGMERSPTPSGGECRPDANRGDRGDRGGGDLAAAGGDMANGDGLLEWGEREFCPPDHTVTPPQRHNVVERRCEGKATKRRAGGRGACTYHRQAW